MKRKPADNRSALEWMESVAGGGMPADSFVGIWKFIARPNLCGTPACVKPPPRYMPYGDSALCKRDLRGFLTEPQKLEKNEN